MPESIPETDNVEVAKIAAALALVPGGGSPKEKIMNFARAYKFVSQAIKEGDELDLTKILEAINQGK